MKSFTFSLAIVLAIYCYSGAALFVENRGTDCVDTYFDCHNILDIVCDYTESREMCRKTCGVCTEAVANYGSRSVSSCKKCGESSKNTYCRFKAGVFGPNCNNPWVESMPESEKKIVLDKHNELRSLVAKGTALPGYKATNMMRLEWDDDLAEGAQLWANQCTFGHDEDRSTCDGAVGQSAAKEAGYNNMDEFKWADVTQGWYNEIEDFKSTSMDLISEFQAKSNFGDIGHFTQVIWAETTKIGCAAISYDGADYPRELLHFCNYYPSGNIRGAPILLTNGDCPSGTSRGSDGLCG